MQDNPLHFLVVIILIPPQETNQRKTITWSYYDVPPTRVFVFKIFRATIFRTIYTYNMIISASISVASALKFRNTGKNDFPVLSVIVISVIEKHVVHAFLGYSLLTLILSVICTIAISESLFYIEPVKKRFDIFVIYIVIFLMNFLIF